MDPLILGCPFLATSNAAINYRLGVTDVLVTWGLDLTFLKLLVNLYLKMNLNASLLI